MFAGAYPHGASPTAATMTPGGEGPIAVKSAIPGAYPHGAAEDATRGEFGSLGKVPPDEK